MKRGEIWTVAGGKDYAGKPRPAVILQDDRFDMTNSIALCAFTTGPTDAPLFRLPIEPNETNGWRAICRLMVDKITTVPKTKIGARVGRLADEDMVRRCPGLPCIAAPSGASNWNRHMLHGALADCPVGIEEVVEREPYAPEVEHPANLSTQFLHRLDRTRVLR